MNSTARRIAYIHDRFPRLVATFVLNEINELERLGLEISCFALARPTEKVVHEAAKRWVERTVYLDSLLSPKLWLAHLYFLLKSPRIYLALLRRHKEYGGKGVFLKGVYLAKLIREGGFRHIHAHWAWSATDAARIAAKLLGITFSFTAHFGDIYHAEDNLKAKLTDAEFTITCTHSNQRYLLKEYGRELEQKLHVVYHGVDLKQFTPSREASRSSVDLLAVGRLVPKKGFVYLVEACRLLATTGLIRSCVIVGEGPDHQSLKSMIDQYGLQEVVHLRGALPQEELIRLYQEAAIVVLPSITINGVAEGIPNVLVEAMAMEIPVIATDVPQIPELVEHEIDGLLVPERDPGALASAIERLLTDKDLRVRLGQKAREKTVAEFNLKENVRRIYKLFSEVG